MENWGLVTFGLVKNTWIVYNNEIGTKFFLVYSESVLLFDETFSSLDDRQNVVQLVTHELAHQWFGNLVTMDWYNND